VNSRFSANSEPSTSFGPNFGIGMNVGRPSTSPRVAVNTALVTGNGRREVDCPRRLGGEQVGDGSHLVVDVDPALVLAAVAQLAAETELEQGELLLQRAAACRQHDPGAQVGDADAGGLGDAGRRLPLGADLGEEALADGRLLGELLLTARTVDADAGSGQEHGRTVVGRCDRLGDQRRALRAALHQLALVGIGPALVADAGAGEMHDGVDAVEGVAVDAAFGG
jgi:hypothetical protein